MLLWTPAFVIGGVGCIMNAAHCGRVHCYITGPLYLLAAVATVLAGTDLVPLRSSWIGGAVLGGTILAYVPEWVRGKYLARA
jgi:predicted ABC-type sugar transport system permease subunit